MRPARLREGLYVSTDENRAIRTLFFRRWYAWIVAPRQFLEIAPLLAIVFA